MAVKKNIKKKPVKPKKILWTESKNLAYTLKLATPKIYPKPPEVSRGATAPLAKLLKRIKNMAIPKKKMRAKPYKIPPYILVNGKKIPRPPKPKELDLKRLETLAESVLRKITPKFDYIPQPGYKLINPHTQVYIPTPRITELACPKRYFGINHDKTSPFSVSPCALAFQATIRYLVLATPKKDFFRNPTKKNPYDVSPTALTFQASPRYTELAQPHPNFGFNHTKDHPYDVSRAALKFMASPRYKVLARPNPFFGVEHNNPNAFVVSRFALKYQITPRMTYLARPKKRFLLLLAAQKANPDYY